MVAVVVASGSILFGNIQSSAAQGDQVQPDGPPVLSETMANPKWTIAHWMSVDEKSHDCVNADDLMARNVTSNITRDRRGNVIASHSLEDYITSCRRRVERETDMVEPQARRWCAYRHTSPRLETICREWEDNKANYIARIMASDAPTLDRYKTFIAGAR